MELSMVETLLIITEQALIHFPLILGAYITVSLMKLPDLSIESAYVFGAICATKVLPLCIHLPLFFTILITIGASLVGGMCVGLLSSLLTHKARIPHLLSSIITIGIFHGVSQIVGGVYLSLNTYKNILALEYIPLHPELLILSIIFIIGSCVGFYFLRTQLGYCLAVFGINPLFFRHYAISTTYVFMSGIIIANALAGLSGYLSAQSNGFADISMGFGKLLLCVTSLILGKIIPHKNISLLIPISGLFAYFTLQQLLLKIGLDLRYFTMIQALVIVIILVCHRRNQTNMYTDHLGV
jgi:putative ABC transport system permease protein